MTASRPEPSLVLPALPTEDDGVRLVQAQDKWGRLMFHGNGAPVLVYLTQEGPGRDRAAHAIWTIFFLQLAAVVLVLIIMR